MMFSIQICLQFMIEKETYIALLHFFQVTLGKIQISSETGNFLSR